MCVRSFATLTYTECRYRGSSAKNTSLKQRRGRSHTHTHAHNFMSGYISSTRPQGSVHVFYIIRTRVLSPHHLNQGDDDALASLQDYLFILCVFLRSLDSGMNAPQQSSSINSSVSRTKPLASNHLHTPAYPHIDVRPLFLASHRWRTSTSYPSRSFEKTLKTVTTSTRFHTTNPSSRARPGEPPTRYSTTSIQNK